MANLYIDAVWPGFQTSKFSLAFDVKNGVNVGLGVGEGLGLPVAVDVGEAVTVGEFVVVKVRVGEEVGDGSVAPFEKNPKR